jgi:hypothetical protein
VSLNLTARRTLAEHRRRREPSYPDRAWPGLIAPRGAASPRRDVDAARGILLAVALGGIIWALVVAAIAGWLA